MRKNNIEKEVKRLAKEKKYEQIYAEYGPKYFRKYVSKDYMKEDIKKLKAEGRFMDIYTKYGKVDLDIYLRDRMNELGVRPDKIDDRILIAKTIKGACKNSMISLTVSSVVMPPTINSLRILKNKKEYQKEIEDYQNKINEYASRFDTENQSDMEIIMRLMKDMHETIYGYGEPQMDILGYLGMDIEKGRIGVCRNMASNIADKLNEINPDYNARIICLYENPDSFQQANITTKVIGENGETEIHYGNTVEIYIDNNIQSKTIKEDNKTIEYKYEGGKLQSKTINKENETYITEYDQAGNILNTKKIIKEEKDGIEIKDEFYNGKLEIHREYTDTYYKSIIYNEDGTVSIIIVADEEKEITSFFKNEKKYCCEINKDGLKTTIYYDESGNETSREEAESEDENIFQIFKKLDEFSSKLEKVQEVKDSKGKVNHAMVAIDIESDNVTLLIDPTNVGLGVYKNGKIIMFNEDKEGVYKKSYIGDYHARGIEGAVEYPIDYIKSFRRTELSIEELEEKYGLEAQNEMLKEIERRDSKKTFREELKIDEGVTYNFDENVITIDKKQMDKGQEINTE